MKTFRTLPLILILCVFAALLAPSAAAQAEEPELGAQSALLVELETNQIFFSKHPDLRVYPASLTKIMTLLLVVEAIDAGTFSLYDKVTAKDGKDTDLEPDSESLIIRTGEVMTLENLIYCAMLASSNTACNIIAEYIAGSVPAFVDLMNARARELGCTGTNFVNVHGLHHEEQYTTAEDLALIAREAVSHTLFLEICNTVSYSVPATNYSSVRALKTTNHLINKDSTYDYYYEGASGVKTGYTATAGYCLVSTATRDGIRLLSVVTGCEAKKSGTRITGIGSFEDTIALYDWAFSSYSYQHVVTSDEIIATLPVKMASGTDKIALKLRGAISALLPNDADLKDFRRDVVLFSEQSGEELVAPITAGTVLGQMTVSRGDTVYGTVSLVAATSVDLSKLAFLESRIQATASDHRVRLIFWILAALAFAYLLLVIRYRVLRIRYTAALRREQRGGGEARRSPSPTESRPKAPPVPAQIASFEEIFAPPAEEKRGVTALLSVLSGAFDKLKTRPEGGGVPVLPESIEAEEVLADEAAPSLSEAAANAPAEEPPAPAKPQEPEEDAPEKILDWETAAPIESRKPEAAAPVESRKPEAAAPIESRKPEAAAPVKSRKPEAAAPIETLVLEKIEPDESFFPFAMDSAILEKLSAPIWTLGPAEEAEVLQAPEAADKNPAPAKEEARANQDEKAAKAAAEAIREKAERDYFEEFFRRH